MCFVMFPFSFFRLLLNLSFRSLRIFICVHLFLIVHILIVFCFAFIVVVDTLSFAFLPVRSIQWKCIYIIRTEWLITHYENWELSYQQLARCFDDSLVCLLFCLFDVLFCIKHLLTLVTSRSAHVCMLSFKYILHVYTSLLV